MATYRLVQRARPSFVTIPFDSYAEAQAFYEKSALLNPTKPYRRAGGGWKVSMLRPDAGKAVYKRVEDWQKPFQGYDNWKGLEALYHIPVAENTPRQELLSHV